MTEWPKQCFRSAAGNLWSISDPVNVRVAKDLLGHIDFVTTERHYIGAQSRLAESMAGTRGIAVGSIWEVVERVRQLCPGTF